MKLSKLNFLQTWGFLLFMVSAPIHSQTILDVYGTKPELAKEIIQKYGPEIIKLEEKRKSIYINKLSSSDLTEFFKQDNQIKEKIKKEFDLLYVDLNTVYYSPEKNGYTTIEVIDSLSRNRLKFVSSLDHATKPQQDIIQQMIDFEAESLDLFMKNQVPAKGVCPINHCIVGFEHPKLKPYLTLFNDGAVKYKDFIIETLQHDPDTHRRAAAAFLVGHFKNPDEVISILTPQVQDPNSGVRNNVIRVIASTMKHANIHKIDPMPFIGLLDSPSETDRNKSLLVLLESIDSKPTQEALIHNAHSQLLNLLALKQPNNHEPAYQILKKISHKEYGEYDLTAWQDWFSKNELV